MRMVPWGYLEIHSATAFADRRFLQGSADELCWWVTHGDSSSSSTYMYSLVDVCFSFTVKHYTSGLCGFSPTPILITSAFDTNRFGKQQLLHVKDRIRDVSGLIYRNWNLLVSFFTFLKKEGRKEERTILKWFRFSRLAFIVLCHFVYFLNIFLNVKRVFFLQHFITYL